MSQQHGARAGHWVIRLAVTAVALGGLIRSVVFAAEPAMWKAGVGRQVITPSEPMWMAGYASRDKPSEGAIHDLYVKALALESPQGERLVIVTSDLIGITASLSASVLEAANERFGLAPRSVLLNASHTHCGPEYRTYKIWVEALSDAEAAKIERYADALPGKFLDAITAAMADLRPAKLAWSQDSADFARNRRFPENGRFVNRQYDEGPVDHDVPVLRVTGADGKLRAVLFGYACHNTTLSFYRFCGDYAGFAQRAVEEAHPGAMALFMQGAAGDQNPYPRRELELAEQHGRTLAAAVERALAAEPTLLAGPLLTARADARLEFEPLPSRDVLLDQLRARGARDQRRAQYLLDVADGRIPLAMTYGCPVQVARFGDELLLVAIGGEVVVDYSIRLKYELAGPHVWVAGYSNDVFGYLPSRRVLLEGGYEGGESMRNGPLPGPFAPTVEERVVGTVRRLVDAISD